MDEPGGWEDDELRRLRAWLDGDGGAAARRSDPGESAGAFVGRVVTTGPPGQYLTVRRVAILGAEVEGRAGVLTVDGSAAVVGVYSVGPGTPAVGEDLVVRRVDYRWVAERRGPHPNPCGTTYPAALTVVRCGLDDGSTFTGWFTTPTVTGPFVLSWGSPPAGMPPGHFADGTTGMGLQANSFVGFSAVTFGNPGWYSAGVPGQSFGGVSITIYLTAVVQGCHLTLYVFAVYHTESGPAWRCNLNLSPLRFLLVTATPFVMHYTLAGVGFSSDLTGAHGGDDLVPDAGGNVGSVVFVA